MSLSGLLFALGAIFSWGTALVFLKVKRVKDAKIQPLVMTMFYSLGYLISALVVDIVMILSGDVHHITWSGVLGGVIWGIGKLLTILAVTSRTGLAMGQSIQCCSNVATTFVAGVCNHEQVWWLQFVGIVVLGVGIVGVASPGMQCTKALVRRSDNVWLDAENVHNDLVATSALKEPVTDSSNVRQLGTAAGVLIALASGVCMGCQALPYKLSSDHDSWSYSFGQALGQFLVILLIFIGAWLLGLVRGPDMYTDVAIGLPPGCVGGALLFAAAVCNTFAVGEIGLIGSCLSQLNMVVASIYGIFLFREIREFCLIVCFFCGALIALAGAFLLMWK